jgi:isocitrate/isopropylmalate dehydrogenase
VVLSAAELLRYLGERDAATRVERAVIAALADPNKRTRDLGGNASLDEIADAILEHLG